MKDDGGITELYDWACREVAAEFDDSGKQPIHIEGHVRRVDLRRIVKFY